MASNALGWSRKPACPGVSAVVKLSCYELHSEPPFTTSTHTQTIEICEANGPQNRSRTNTDKNRHTGTRNLAPKTETAYSLQP